MGVERGGREGGAVVPVAWAAAGGRRLRFD